MPQQFDDFDTQKQIDEYFAERDYWEWQQQRHYEIMQQEEKRRQAEAEVETITEDDLITAAQFLDNIRRNGTCSCNI